VEHNFPGTRRPARRPDEHHLPVPDEGSHAAAARDQPQGAPLGLTLDDAPALGVGFGIHAGTSHGARFNAEVSYHWNQGDYTLYLADAPDRHGRFNLSGVQLLIGVTFG
jgi:hypothetical protein